MSRSGLAVHLQAFCLFPIVQLNEVQDRRLDLLDGITDAAPEPTAGQHPEKTLYSVSSRARSRREVEDPAEDAQGSEQDCSSLPLTTARICMQRNLHIRSGAITGRKWVLGMQINPVLKGRKLRADHGSYTWEAI